MPSVFEEANSAAPCATCAAPVAHAPPKHMCPQAVPVPLQAEGRPAQGRADDGADDGCQPHALQVEQLPPTAPRSALLLGRAARSGMWAHRMGATHAAGALSCPSAAPPRSPVRAISSYSSRSWTLRLTRYPLAKCHATCASHPCSSSSAFLQLRSIIKDYWDTYRLPFDHGRIKTKHQQASSMPSAKKVEALCAVVQSLMAELPPVLHHWLVDTFRTPSAWFDGRLAFTRSCSVMSMIGFAVGLGDRHLENILVDSTSCAAPILNLADVRTPPSFASVFFVCRLWVETPVRAPHRAQGFADARRLCLPL